MAKEELMQFDGLVIEILPDARYRVQLDQGHEIVAYTAGKMKKNRIKTLAGDRVTVEMSPYDLEKGRVPAQGRALLRPPSADARPVPPPLIRRIRDASPFREASIDERVCVQGLRGGVESVRLARFTHR